LLIRAAASFGKRAASSLSPSNRAASLSGFAWVGAARVGIYVISISLDVDGSELLSFGDNCKCKKENNKRLRRKIYRHVF